MFLPLLVFFLLQSGVSQITTTTTGTGGSSTSSYVSPPAATTLTTIASTTTTTSGGSATTTAFGATTANRPYTFPPASQNTILGNAYVPVNTSSAVSLLSVTGDLYVAGQLTLIPAAVASVTQHCLVSGILQTTSNAQLNCGGFLNISTGAHLGFVLVANPGASSMTFTVVSHGSLQRFGQFEVVEAFSSDTTVTIINPVVSYSAGTISVTVDVVPRAGTAEALPTGALVGIVLGTIVIGVILVIAVLLVRRAQHAKNTEYMKQKYDEMNGKTTYTQAP